MAATLDEQMETASQALADLDYARCESLCIDALTLARETADWVMYQRILLPLQETRRQRRQAALDGPILLGTPSDHNRVAKQLAEVEQGCLVLTQPLTADDAKGISEAVHQSKRPIELLYANNASNDAVWLITSLIDEAFNFKMPAPKSQWLGQWVDPATITPPTPAHWFMQASEAMGDFALSNINAELGSLNYLQALEHALSYVDDHEILHQRLASAAKALHEAKR